MQKTLLAGIWIALVGWMLSPLALAATAQEITDLKYMRSEEKLARDLYAALYTKWKDPLFDNISQSEQRHMDAVLGLLTAYGVSDPVAGLQAGVLPDAGLQSLTSCWRRARHRCRRQHRRASLWKKPVLPTWSRDSPARLTRRLSACTTIWCGDPATTSNPSPIIC